METITITFSKENIEDLHHALFMYETRCLLDDDKAMYEAIRQLRKYIDREANINH